MRLPTKVLSGTALTLLSVSALAGGSSQVINGFHYSSCNPKKECVEIVAPKAWLSFVQGGFSTAGDTELRIHSPSKPSRVFKGEASNLNGKLQMITLEQSDGGVVTYSLDTAELGVFEGGRL